MNPPLYARNGIESPATIRNSHLKLMHSTVFGQSLLSYQNFKKKAIRNYLGKNREAKHGLLDGY
jgi:hypothetical protein